MADRLSWRAYDSFETRISRVGGEMVEAIEYAQKAGCTQQEYTELMEVARHWSDVSRQVRNEVRDRIKERGHRG